MRDDFRDNEGIEKYNGKNTEIENNGIVEDMPNGKKGKTQNKEELEKNEEGVRAEAPSLGEKETPAYVEEASARSKEEYSCEEPRTGTYISETVSERKKRGKGKNKRRVVAIISAAVAAALAVAILLGTLLTVFVAGILGVGGLGTLGLIMFNMVELQEIAVDESEINHVDVGIGQDMTVTRIPEGRDEQTEDMPITKVVEQVADSVVEIITEGSSSGVLSGIGSGAGSGVIISENGYIVTNHHVINGAGAITVRLTDGREYEAGVVGSDADTDIALIKIDATGLCAAVIGNSGDIAVGQEVVAIGNPLGTLGGTVTDGIISALDRTIMIDGHSMTLLQTNAAINPGNSGGGLFNRSGELIGIVNAKQSETGVEGLGFAIPVDIAWETVKSIAENEITITENYIEKLY